jgi:hypothetical protein
MELCTSVRGGDRRGGYGLGNVISDVDILYNYIGNLPDDVGPTECTS